jgi:hypothetical protein
MFCVDYDSNITQQITTDTHTDVLPNNYRDVTQLHTVNTQLHNGKTTEKRRNRKVFVGDRANNSGWFAYETTKIFIFSTEKFLRLC